MIVGFDFSFEDREVIEMLLKDPELHDFLLVFSDTSNWKKKGTPNLVKIYRKLGMTNYAGARKLELLRKRATELCTAKTTKKKSSQNY